ncbi:hypothetical protein BX286_7018 [Streptomyces sp. 3211.6]|uniref:DUF7224 domain-containing protein n=1 Tax=Streptomyces sp. 3211.6 TaxID=1938845 RepID=UPI000EAB4F56|nr:hypothetical protein [Streptomyces sp. 3211.6]RKS97204.1 hypothetical protein BX286_7018 [Streptomyces sp. 3211.6]
MKPWTLLRSSSATVLLPVLLCFIVLLLRDTITMTVTAGYGPSVLGRATYALPFAIAACAASAAWEGARLRRGGVFGQAPARGRLGIVLPVLVPVWLMGVLGLLTSLAVSVVATGAAPAPSHLGMLGADGLLLAAATLTGYLAGRLLPGVVAAPVALTAGFCLAAFPVSMSSGWPRQLVAAAFSECCSLDSVIDPRAVWAPVAFAGGLCAAALLLVHRPTLRNRAVALLLAAAGTAAALPPAVGLGYSPVTARDESELVCDTGGRPEVCLWPEVAADGQVVAQTRTFAARLEQAGVRLPPTLTDARDLAPGEARLGIKNRPRDAEDIAYALASAVLPPGGLPECARITGRFLAAPALVPLSAWVTAVALQSPPRSGQISPDDAALLQQVLRAPREQQLAWYEYNRQALTTCDQPARLTLPGGAG